MNYQFEPFEIEDVPEEVFVESTLVIVLFVDPDSGKRIVKWQTNGDMSLLTALALLEQTKLEIWSLSHG